MSLPTTFRQKILNRIFDMFQYAGCGLLDIFFPRCCPICGSVLEDNEIVICNQCLARLPRTEQSVLRGNLTEDLFAGVHHFRRGAAFLFFDKNTNTQRLIHSMKYHERPEIAYALGREAACDFMQSDFFDGIDLIIPIPLHPKRLRERGFNQSEWIARALSETTNIPMDTSHVTRVRNNPQQALQSAQARETNVAGVFKVNHPEDLYHKHILIVDDLITTGATIRACIDAMKVCRGAEFSIFALGKAR